MHLCTYIRLHIHFLYLQFESVSSNKSRLLCSKTECFANRRASSLIDTMRKLVAHFTLLFSTEIRMVHVPVFSFLVLVQINFIRYYLAVISQRLRPFCFIKRFMCFVNTTLVTVNLWNYADNITRQIQLGYFYLTRT